MNDSTYEREQETGPRSRSRRGDSFERTSNETVVCCSQAYVRRLEITENVQFPRAHPSNRRSSRSSSSIGHSVIRSCMHAFTRSVGQSLDRGRSDHSVGRPRRRPRDASSPHEARLLDARDDVKRSEVRATRRDATRTSEGRTTSGTGFRVEHTARRRSRARRRARASERSTDRSRRCGRGRSRRRSGAWGDSNALDANTRARKRSEGNVR